MRPQPTETGGDRSGRGEGGESGTKTTIERGRRVVVGVLGGALVVSGLRRRSLPGIAVALVGGWLLARAFSPDGRLGERLDLPVPTGRSEGEEPEARTTDVNRSITVGRPPEEVYEAWRDPESFSRVVGDAVRVTVAGEDRLRWAVDGPFGREITWETRFVEEVPGERLRWETPPDAVVPNRGTVRFRPAPGDRGTVVTLSAQLDPPGGALGTAALERLDVVPSTLAGKALGRFKSLVETGEIATLEDNPSARGRGDRL